MKKFFSILDVVCSFSVMFMWVFIVACFSYGFFHTTDINEQLLVMTMVVGSGVLIATYYHNFVRSVKNMIAMCKKNAQWTMRL